MSKSCDNTDGFTYLNTYFIKFVYYLDIDECSASPYPCDQNANCYNKEGSHNCFCYLGFDGNGTTCEGTGGTKVIKIVIIDGVNSFSRFSSLRRDRKNLRMRLYWTWERRYVLCPFLESLCSKRFWASQLCLYLKKGEI